jgi:hypothetical protein
MQHCPLRFLTDFMFQSIAEETDLSVRKLQTRLSALPPASPWTASN